MTDLSIIKDRIAESFDPEAWAKDENTLRGQSDPGSLQRIYVEERRKTFRQRANGAIRVFGRLTLFELLRFWWEMRKWR